MNFISELQEATLIKRYKRFFADVTLASGEEVTAHCPNTGSMKSCGAPGDTVYVSHNPDPKRKLAYTWELTKTKGGYIGVNTHKPNRIVEEAIANGLIPELTGYASMKREAKYGEEKSKIDLLLDEGEDKRRCYVEIKNTTLLDQDTLLFPDAVTSRGLKHLRELQMMVNQGHRSVMLFFVNRPDGKYFTPAKEIHPEYAEALREVSKGGVEILAYRANTTLTESTVGKPVKVTL